MEQFKKAQLVGTGPFRVTQYQFLGFGSNAVLINDLNDSPAHMDLVPLIPQTQQSRVARHEFGIEKRHMRCQRLTKLRFVILPETGR